MKKTFQLERYEFDSGVPGPNFVITARIHGDEPSGEHGIRRVIDEICFKGVSLEKGKMVFFPVLNTLAAFEYCRGVEIDANRDLRIYSEDEKKEKAERVIRNSIYDELKAIAEQSKIAGQPWYLLDLHSVPLASEPHCVATDQSEKAINFAKAVGLEKIYCDFFEAYLNVEIGDIKAQGFTEEKAYQNQPMGIIYLARALGAEISLCVESGQNDDPASREIAYHGIRQLMKEIGINTDYQSQLKAADRFKRITMHKILIKRDEEDQLVGIEKEGQSLSPGQVVLKGTEREVSVPDEDKNWVIAHALPNNPIGMQLGYISYIDEL